MKVGEAESACSWLWMDAERSRLWPWSRVLGNTDPTPPLNRGRSSFVMNPSLKPTDRNRGLAIYVLPASSRTRPPAESRVGRRRASTACKWRVKAEKASYRVLLHEKGKRRQSQSETLAPIRRERSAQSGELIVRLAARYISEGMRRGIRRPGDLLGGGGRAGRGAVVIGWTLTSGKSSALRGARLKRGEHLVGGAVERIGHTERREGTAGPCATTLSLPRRFGSFHRWETDQEEEQLEQVLENELRLLGMKLLLDDMYRPHPGPAVEAPRRRRRLDQRHRLSPTGKVDLTRRSGRP